MTNYVALIRRFSMFAGAILAHCCQYVLNNSKFSQEPNLTLYKTVDTKERTAGTKQSNEQEILGEKITQLRMNKDSSVSTVTCYRLETRFDLYQLHFIRDHLCGLVVTVPYYRSRSRVRFPALPNFLRSGGSGTGSTQPHEYNRGAT
jgi:hypothetical protein